MSTKYITPGVATFTPASVTLAVQANTVFGSGASFCRLMVGGLRILPTEDYIRDDNNFVAVYTATVPLRRLLEAEHVSYELSHLPGGSFKFEGSGRSFVRALYKHNHGRWPGDALKKSLWTRPRYWDLYAKRRREFEIARVHNMTKLGRAQIENGRFRILRSKQWKRGALVRSWSEWRTL